MNTEHPNPQAPDLEANAAATTCDGNQLLDQIAAATQDGPTVSKEEADGFWNDLVMAGSSVPIIQQPVPVRLGIDAAPDVPHHWVLPSLADIDDVEDLELKAQLLLARDPQVSDEREKAMIKALSGQNCWYATLLQHRLQPWSEPPKKAKKPKKSKCSEAEPPLKLPALFAACFTNAEEESQDA